MSTDERLQTLVAAISSILGSPASDGNATLGDLGINSGHLPQLIMACEDVYGPKIDFGNAEFSESTSLRDIHEMALRQS